MSIETRCWGIFLSVLIGSGPATGQLRPVRQFSGLSTLNLADREALELNKLRRGASPLSNLQLTLFWGRGLRSASGPLHPTAHRPF
ncbi:MAG: hypothetical protein FJY95_14590 [Candidatus Handelsmanbacteria bacterium]|nr:hypothetical protein [Candidatus Handelsmanbacteria bacterium]